MEKSMFCSLTATLRHGAAALALGSALALAVAPASAQTPAPAKPAAKEPAAAMSKEAAALKKLLEQKFPRRDDQQRGEDRVLRALTRRCSRTS
jgi:hypothetical protein